MNNKINGTLPKEPSYHFFTNIFLRKREGHLIEAPLFPIWKQVTNSAVEFGPMPVHRVASLRWFVWEGALGLVAPPGALLFVL